MVVKMRDKKINKKAYLQISFAWLFAIVVGAFILFLAIFFVVKLIDTEQTIQDAKTGKEIGILLNPLETGFETAKTSSLSFPAETRIYNKCNNKGVFGRQIIQISQKSFNKWTETDIDVGFSNKYIFSEEPVEGKKFYVFSKPFNFPFKVSDLIYITSSEKDYCFKNAPEEIEHEIFLLNQKNLLIENCSTQSVKVCFGAGNCEIKVNYNLNKVEKDGDIMYFEEDALMYGAIFSDKEVYECQVKRLMQRVEQLALLYKDKAAFISEKGCDSNLDLFTLSTLANNLEDSRNLALINSKVEEIKDKNDDSGDCRLW